MGKGTILAVAALALAYLLRLPVQALAANLLGDRGQEGGDLDWIPTLASAATIGLGLLVAGLVLSFFRPDPARLLAEWAASAGLTRAAELEGPVGRDVAVTRSLRPGRRYCIAAFEGEAPVGRLELRVIRARGPRSWFPLGKGDESPPRVVTQFAIVGLGPLATFTIEPQGWLSNKDKRKRPPTVSTESVEFGMRWLLHGKSPRDIHACLTPAVMARLLDDEALGMVYEFSPGALLTAVEDVLGAAPELDRRLAVLRDVVRRVPRFAVAP